MLDLASKVGILIQHGVFNIWKDLSSPWFVTFEVGMRLV
jgi:hypothetical protein